MPEFKKDVDDAVYDSLDQYFKEINRENLLDAEEELKLSKAIKEGNEYAFNKLVKANLRFVVFIAKQYKNNILSLSDLINEGNVGLMKAARTFDGDRGVKFISKAVWDIRATITQALIDKPKVVRLPGNKFSERRMIKKFKQSFEQENERLPTSFEIIERFGLAPEEEKLIQESEHRIVELDAPAYSFNGSRSNLLFNEYYEEGEIFGSVEDFYNPLGLENETDIEIKNKDLRIDIMRCLKTLPAKESLVLKLYFGMFAKSERFYFLELALRHHNFLRAALLFRDIKEHILILEKEHSGIYLGLSEEVLKKYGFSGENLIVFQNYQRFIVEITKGDGFSFSEIAEFIDLTEQRIMQIKTKGLNRMYHTSRSRILKAYLG